MKRNRIPSLPRRRGVLLLVILGLLAMFGLVAVAFVVVAGQAQRAARTVQRVEQAYDPPQQTLNQAILQVLRGSNNPQSVIRAHSLLEGIYGNEWFMGAISGLNTNVCGQQLFEFTAIAGDPIPRTGCVMTILKGRLAGQSTHIVSISPDGSKYQARAFEGGMPADGDTFIINGPPFSGMGFGYNPDSGRLDAVGGPGPVALLPNLPLSFYYNATSNPQSNPPGGANGDYNAPDYQTMLLGAVVYNPQTLTATPQTIIPSLHRPDLIAYWQQQGSWNVDLQRLVMMRPNPVDHPNFPGNGKYGTAFNPILGPWDVDNDGDSINDSVWVDFGFPVRSAPDGRKYKPMVAVLCVDMDGRLNVNAHGSIWQTQQNYYPGQTAIAVSTESPLSAGTFAGMVPSLALPRGQGYGPADINLLPLFLGNSNEPAPMDRFGALLTGYPDKTLEGRYGELTRYAALSGLLGAGFTGETQRNGLALNKLFQYGPGRPPYQSNYWDFFVAPNTMDATKLDAFGAPPDISGTGAVALDLGGRPLYLDYLYRTIKNPQTGAGSAFPAVDNPYMLNLSQYAPRGMPYPMQNLPDNPYSPAELERILRPFDKDSATLPGRLFRLTAADGITSGLLGRRHAVTTDSWNVPTPSPAMPLSLRNNLPARRGRHVIDLLMATGATTPAVWRQLLPPEMLSGCKLDLTRPLGNGRDSNGNGAVNDPAEADSVGGMGQEKIWLYANPTAGPGEFLYTFFTGDNLSLTPQQMQARYLYVLAVLLSDLPYLDARTGNRENTCRFLAQWAVNVVDFCDRDSIMTRFEYTVFQSPAPGQPPAMAGGWNPTGQHVVWGCERPELLFGESIAMHDRRTEDLEFKNEDDTDNKKTDATENPDKDFDQKYRPQGSLFFELYNPQSPFDPPAGEFYSAPGAGSGVLLSKTTPTSNDPVWRVIVTDCQREAEEQRDPDDPVIGSRPNIERSVYFVNPAGLSDTKDGTRYYPGTPRPFGIVPGGYAVVGSAEKSVAKGKRTYLGFETGKTDYATTTRHITLDAAEVTAANPAVVRNNGDGGVFVNPPEVVPIDMPRRLSISEPVKGYDDLEGTAEKESSVDPVKYKTPFDTPFDKQLGEDNWNLLGADKTTVAYRMLHLQRLANPLLPYHETTNPYRTIDSMAVDLTAFNGIESAAKNDPSAPASGQTMFESRQRGDTTALTAPDPINGLDIWKQEAVDKVLKTSVGTVGGHIFDKKLAHSFGFLSRVFGSPIAPGSGLAQGAPQSPFPWLTWNNRPFTSPLELMLVPVYSSSKLLVRTKGDTGAVLNKRTYYNFVRQTQAAGIDPYLGQDKTPFTHLLNFFQSGPPGSTGGGPGFYRILDYVHIPSRFAGTEVQINPAVAMNGNHPFRPPFNGIPTYREPGRINLNTILCPEVFAGLMNFYPGWETAWQQFVKSRAGDNRDPTTMFAINAAMPSRFGKPFRTFAGAELFPPGVGMFDHEVDATILRHTPDNPQMPLFGNVPDDPRNISPYNNIYRNPYFAYQGISRLGNLVTTHSNVFAVWITVGYFEVRPWQQGPDLGHPDGYELLQELGSDTGNIERHRAFYIIDRTIPVGFSRGKDLNAENAIILKRIIE